MSDGYVFHLITSMLGKILHASYTITRQYASPILSLESNSIDTR
jgi:hypothetical protein